MSCTINVDCHPLDMHPCTLMMSIICRTYISHQRCYLHKTDTGRSSHGASSCLWTNCISGSEWPPYNRSMYNVYVSLCISYQLSLMHSRCIKDNVYGTCRWLRIHIWQCSIHIILPCTHRLNYSNWEYLMGSLWVNVSIVCGIWAGHHHVK